MKILALEFSSQERSAAVGELVEGELHILSSAADLESTGIALVDGVLSAAALQPADIGLIAVGLGPGSYGGVRSSIALAQGWQLALNTPVLGISSVEVLLREAVKRGLQGQMNIVIDAQRQECYRAEFLLGGAQPMQQRPLEIVPIRELSGPAFGPGAGRLVSGGLDLNPTAESLLELAAGRTDFTPSECLQPIYLRETAFVKAPPPRFG